MDSRKAKEKAAGREQRQHGLVSMCLPVPTVYDFEKFDELLNIVIAKGSSGPGIERRECAWFRCFAGVQRFALEFYGGALPHTPPSFRLIWEPRFAELSGNPNFQTV